MDRQIDHEDSAQAGFGMHAEAALRRLHHVLAERQAQAVAGTRQRGEERFEDSRLLFMDSLLSSLSCHYLFIDLSLTWFSFLALGSLSNADCDI